jgi:hypothetical protein
MRFANRRTRIDDRAVWSRSTLKRRRHVIRERRATFSAHCRAKAARQLRDPRTGAFIRVLGQTIKRERDPQTGRFFNPEDPVVLAAQERERAALADVFDRYPLRPLVRTSPRVTDAELVQFTTDAERVQYAIARQIVALDARRPSPTDRRARGGVYATPFAVRLVQHSRRVRYLHPALELWQGGQAHRGCPFPTDAAPEIYRHAVETLTSGARITPSKRRKGSTESEIVRPVVLARWGRRVRFGNR